MLHQYDKPTAVTLHPECLDAPLHWRKPRCIFVCSMSDLFHEDVPAAYSSRVLKVAEACPQHRFIYLTKRPAKMQTVVSALQYIGKGPGPNVLLGISAENQARLVERRPYLRDTPCATRVLSLEPLLGPMDLASTLGLVWEKSADTWMPSYQAKGPFPDCVIVGGESGPGARECRVEWIADIVRQCVAAGVPVFVKQLGSWWAKRFGFTKRGHSKGQCPEDWPRELWAPALGMRDLYVDENPLRQFPPVLRGGAE